MDAMEYRHSCCTYAPYPSLHDPSLRGPYPKSGLLGRIRVSSGSISSNKTDRRLIGYVTKKGARFERGGRMNCRCQQERQAMCQGLFPIGDRMSAALRSFYHCNFHSNQFRSNATHSNSKFYTSSTAVHTKQKILYLQAPKCPLS